MGNGASSPLKGQRSKKNSAEIAEIEAEMRNEQETTLVRKYTGPVNKSDAGKSGWMVDEKNPDAKPRGMSSDDYNDDHAHASRHDTRPKSGSWTVDEKDAEPDPAILDGDDDDEPMAKPWTPMKKSKPNIPTHKDDRPKPKAHAKPTHTHASKPKAHAKATAKPWKPKQMIAEEKQEAAPAEAAQKGGRKSPKPWVPKDLVAEEKQSGRSTANPDRKQPRSDKKPTSSAHGKSSRKNSPVKTPPSLKTKRNKRLSLLQGPEDPWSPADPKPKPKHKPKSALDKIFKKQRQSLSSGGLQALLCKRVPQPIGVNLRFLKKLARGDWLEHCKRPMKWLQKRLVAPAVKKLKGVGNCFLDTLPRGDLDFFSGPATHAVSYCTDTTFVELLEALIASQGRGAEGLLACIHATAYSDPPDQQPPTSAKAASKNNSFFYIDILCASDPYHLKKSRDIFAWRNAFQHVPRVLLVVANDDQEVHNVLEDTLHLGGGQHHGPRVLTQLQNLTEALIALARGVELQIAFVPRVWSEWVAKLDGELSTGQDAQATIASWWNVDVKKAKSLNKEHKDMLRNSFWTKPRQGKVLLLQAGLRTALLTRLCKLAHGNSDTAGRWRPLVCHLLRRFWRYDEASRCSSVTVKQMTDKHGDGAKETLHALVGHADNLQLCVSEEGDALYHHITRTTDERRALQALVSAADPDSESVSACLGVRRAVLLHDRVAAWLRCQRQIADAAQVLRTMHWLHYDSEFSAMAMHTDFEHAHDAAYTEIQHDVHMMCALAAPCGVSGRSGFEMFIGQPSAVVACRARLVQVVRWLVDAKEAVERMLNVEDRNDIDVGAVAALSDNEWTLPQAECMDDRCQALLCRNVFAFAQLRNLFPEQLSAATNQTALNVGGMLRAKVNLLYPVFERSRKTALPPRVKALVKALKGQGKPPSTTPPRVPTKDGIAAVVEYVTQRIASLAGQVRGEHVLWLDTCVDIAAHLLGHDSTNQQKLGRDVLKAVRPLLDSIIKKDKRKSAKGSPGGVAKGSPGGGQPLPGVTCSPALRLKWRCMRILGYSLSRTEWLTHAHGRPTVNRPKDSSAWHRLRNFRSACSPAQACMVQLETEAEERPVKMLRSATEAVASDLRVRDEEPEDKGLKLVRQCAEAAEEAIDPCDPLCVSILQARSQCLLWRASALVRGCQPALKFSLEECQQVAAAKLSLVQAGNLMRRSCVTRVRGLGLRHLSSVSAALQLSLTLACDHERRVPATAVLRSTFGFASSTNAGEGLLLQSQHALATVLVMDDRLNDAKAVLEEAIGMDHSKSNTIAKSQDPAPRNSLPIDVLATQMADVHMRLKDYSSAAQWYQQVQSFVPTPAPKDTGAAARTLRICRAQLTAMHGVCVGMQYEKHINPEHPDTEMPSHVEKALVASVANLDKNLSLVDKTRLLSSLDPQLLRMLYLQMTLLSDVRKWEELNIGLQQLVDAMKKNSEKKKSFRWQSPIFLKAMERLTDSYVDFGEMDVALPLLQEIVELHHHIDKAVDEDTVLLQAKDTHKIVSRTAKAKIAMLRQSLGGMFMDLGRFGEAEKHLKSTLAIMEANQGPKSMGALGILNQLAVLLKKSKRFAESQRMYERALEGYRETTGDDSEATLVVLANLANLLVDVGDFGLAQDHYATALEATERRYGRDHNEYYLCMFGFAKLSIKSRHYNEAAGMLEQVKDGFLKFYSSFDVKFSMWNEAMSDLKSAQGDDIKAEELLRLALSGYEERMSHTHPDTLRVTHKLAKMLSLKAQLNPFQAKAFNEEANTLYHRTLTEYYGLHGPLHPDCVSILKQLATDKYESKRMRDPILLNAIQDLADQNELEGTDPAHAKGVAEELFKWINGEIDRPNVKNPPRILAKRRSSRGKMSSEAPMRSRSGLSTQSGSDSDDSRPSRSPAVASRKARGRRRSDSGSDSDDSRPSRSPALTSRKARNRRRSDSGSDSDNSGPSRRHELRGHASSAQLEPFRPESDSDDSRRSRSPVPRLRRDTRSGSDTDNSGPSRRHELRGHASSAQLEPFRPSDSESDSADGPARRKSSGKRKQSPGVPLHAKPVDAWSSKQKGQLRRAITRHNTSYEGPKLSRKKKWAIISDGVDGKTPRECFEQSKRR